jgi:signal transduction histidine kinase
VGVAVAMIGWLIAVCTAAAAWCAATRRKEVVARACHELRGPITTARLALDLGARVGELTQERLRAVELELDRATLALDDLAGTSSRARRRVGRIAGRSREVVSVEEVVNQTVEAWRAAAAARGVELNVGQLTSARVRCNRLRLAQATGNLIANAIEHGGGTVEVRGRVERSGLRIEVVDQGPGLGRPLPELSRLARRTGRGGNRFRGYGLAVAGAVATAHGGRLSAAPSERGARVVLELPIAREHPSEQGT